MHRHALTEDQWRRLQAVLPKQKAGPPATLGDRLFIEAVLFRAKTGMPWRDLPERFGPWKSVYNRFANWAKKDVWSQVFRELRLGVCSAPLRSSHELKLLSPKLARASIAERLVRAGFVVPAEPPDDGGPRFVE